LVRYNSRLPLVIYVPEGVEVRYRVWRADPDSKVAAKG
jgi:ecotin